MRSLFKGSKRNKIILLRNKIRWEINHSKSPYFIERWTVKLNQIQQQIKNYNHG